MPVVLYFRRKQQEDRRGAFQKRESKMRLLAESDLALNPLNKSLRSAGLMNHAPATIRRDLIYQIRMFANVHQQTASYRNRVVMRLPAAPGAIRPAGFRILFLERNFSCI
ncbi:hypothetical protein [Pseudoramibacter faecis]|uniref:hypothetical protein n=1 Tax=Pseudoramibacter faecis TaxID=3108534 RepID=UPI002E77F14C|nr:hypothetical protein [Pseudoramibacter sp. HA2172]